MRNMTLDIAKRIPYYTFFFVKFSPSPLYLRTGPTRIFKEHFNFSLPYMIWEMEMHCTGGPGDFNLLEMSKGTVLVLRS